MMSIQRTLHYAFLCLQDPEGLQKKHQTADKIQKYGESYEQTLMEGCVGLPPQGLSVLVGTAMMG